MLSNDIFTGSRIAVNTSNTMINSFKVMCNTVGSGGYYYGCVDGGSCLNCPLNGPFGNDDCLAVVPPELQQMNLRLACGDTAKAGTSSPAIGSVEVNLFGNPQCDNSARLSMVHSSK